MVILVLVREPSARSAPFEVKVIHDADRNKGQCPRSCRGAGLAINWCHEPAGQPGPGLARGEHTKWLTRRSICLGCKTGSERECAGTLGSKPSTGSISRMAYSS